MTPLGYIDGLLQPNPSCLLLAFLSSNPPLVASEEDKRHCERSAEVTFRASGEIERERKAGSIIHYEGFQI